jgi:hypothetical protein
VGGVVTQEGDSEAVGWAPAGRIGDILAALGAWRRESTPAGEGAHGAEATLAAEPGKDPRREHIDASRGQRT